MPRPLSGLAGHTQLAVVCSTVEYFSQGPLVILSSPDGNLRGVRFSTVLY